MCHQNEGPSFTFRYLVVLFVLSSRSEASLHTWQVVQVAQPAKVGSSTHDSCRRYRSHSGCVHMQIANRTKCRAICTGLPEIRRKGTKSADDWPKCRVAPGRALPSPTTLLTPTFPPTTFSEPNSNGNLYAKLHMEIQVARRINWSQQRTKTEWEKKNQRKTECNTLEKNFKMSFQCAIEGRCLVLTQAQNICI